MTPDEIDIRLAKLEAITDERWAAHARQSDNFWNNIKDTNSRIDGNVEKIFTWLNDLPCKTRAENTKGIWQNINALWRVVSAVFIAVIGAFIAHIFGKI